MATVTMLRNVADRTTSHSTNSGGHVKKNSNDRKLKDSGIGVESSPSEVVSSPSARKIVLHDKSEASKSLSSPSSTNRVSRPMNGELNGFELDDSNCGGENSMLNGSNRSGVTQVTDCSNKGGTSNSNSTNTTPILTGHHHSERSQYALLLVLVPLNGTFDKKSLVVPFAPDVLKLGRQTNAKTVPAPDNGFFDSRVLSRQHAEVWADKSTGKVYIKDAKSSNGTYINSERLSGDNTESEPHELKKNDILELGIDISNDEGSLVHRKISARVEKLALLSLESSVMMRNDGSTGVNKSTNSSTNNMNNNNNNSNNINNNNNNNINNNNNNNNYNNNNNNNQLNNINGTTNGGPINNALTRKYGVSGSQSLSRADALDVALFGDIDSSLEDLALGHAKRGIGGMLLPYNIATNVAFETAVRKLVGEVHSVKKQGLKMKSVTKLLEDIQAQQKKASVLSSLTNQLSVKDGYIAELERKLAAREETVEQLQQKLEVQNALIHDLNSKKHLPSEKDDESCAVSSQEIKIQSLTSELAETSAQLELYISRAIAAEDMAVKNSKTIAELVRNLEEKQQLGQNAPLTPARTHSPGPSARSAQVVSHPSLATKVVPVTTALGVVVLGISLMSIMNGMSRDR